MGNFIQSIEIKRIRDSRLHCGGPQGGPDGVHRRQGWTVYRLIWARDQGRWVVVTQWCPDKPILLWPRKEENDIGKRRNKNGNE